MNAHVGVSTRSSAFPLYCNNCWEVPKGKAFKTLCDHVFCERCLSSEASRGADGCPRCDAPRALRSSVLEFQVVGAPILDEQLVDVRSTLLAVAAANGVHTVDIWTAELQRLERAQLNEARERMERSLQRTATEVAERDAAWSQREHDLKQRLAGLEHEHDRTRKEKDTALANLQQTYSALEDRTRQMENWKAMYEALRGAESSSTSLVVRPSSSRLAPPAKTGSALTSFDGGDVGSSGSNHRGVGDGKNGVLPSSSRLTHESPSSSTLSLRPLPGKSRYTFSAPPPEAPPSAGWAGAPPPPAPRSSLQLTPRLSLQRPPTRENLSSVLGRYSSNLGKSSNVARSPFFAPSALRAMSPATKVDYRR